MGCNYCGKNNEQVKTASGHVFCTGTCKDLWAKWSRKFLIDARTKEREAEDFVYDTSVKETEKEEEEDSLARSRRLKGHGKWEDFKALREDSGEDVALETYSIKNYPLGGK